MAEQRYLRLDEGELLGALAEGAFGRVYAAVDTQSGDTVAVKRQKVPGGVSAHELCVLMALRQDEHPNVLRLLDHFIVTKGSGARAEHMLYLVFEFMDSTLWHFWLRRRRMVQLDVCVELIRQMAAGVAHIHTAGLIHTDLSMGNMLLSKASLLKVADLGCAVGAASIVLRPGEERTTLHARAPEVLLGALELCAVVDLWSLGVLALALLGGTLAFWRPERHEKPMEGLWATDARIPGFEPSGEGHWRSKACMATYANQVALLGPPPAEELPEVTRWQGFQAARHLPGPIFGSPRAFLADLRLVRRPLAAAAQEYVLGLLRWRPEFRVRADACRRSELLRAQPCAPDPASQALVDRMGVEELRALVLHSVCTGLPVLLTSETPIPKRPRPEGAVLVSPASLSGRSDEETPAEARGGSVVGLEPSGGGGGELDAEASSQAAAKAGAEAPKRVRMRWKANCLAHPSVGTGASAGSVAECLSAPASPVTEAQARVEVASATTCACRGNCGQRLCVQAKNRRARGGHQGLICSRACLPGEVYCGFCKCEMCGAGRQACHGGGRWCAACYRDEKLASSQGMYINRYGKHRLPTAWSKELQMTAKFAYATLLAPSADAEAWAAFLAGFLRWRGETSWTSIADPGDWMLLVVVACIKWPPVVAQALPLLDGFEPRLGTAEGWRAYLGRLVKAADGRCWQNLHRSTSPGRIRCYFGLVWFCKALELLEGIDGKADDGDVINLGASQKGWLLREGVGRLSHVLEGVRKAGVRLPAASSQDVMPAPSQVRAHGKTLQRVSSVIWGKRGVYASGTLCRMLLELMEREYGEEVWDELTMGELMQWIPDMQGHMEHVAALCGKEARHRFGMSPLRVAREACVWGMVRKDDAQVLASASPQQVLNAIAGFEPRASASSNGDRGEAFWPQPHEWVRDLARESVS